MLFESVGDWEFAHSVQQSLFDIAKELKRANDLKEIELTNQQKLMDQYFNQNHSFEFDMDDFEL